MDEISRIKSVFGELHFRKLSVMQERLLEEALEELRSRSGTAWGVFQTGWPRFRRRGRTQVNMHSDVILVRANGGGTRPSWHKVIVLDERNERVLLPYENIKDFFALAAMLDIQSLYGYATLINYLVPFLGGDGFEFKKPPKPIRNDEDARAFGFEFLDDYLPYTQGKNSFWQGYYAQYRNYPFVLTLDTEHVPPFMKITFIDVKPPPLVR